MPVITEETVRELAGYRASAPVTSCYLDVDGRRYVRHQDFEHELEVLLRQARAKDHGGASVRSDLDRIQEYVKRGIDRSNVRGLAIFACGEEDLFRVIALPVPVRNQVIVNAAPAVAQLEAVLRESQRYAVLAADRQRARVFVFDLDGLVERTELLDELPRDYDQRGERERGDVSGHVEALTQQHIRRAAQAAFDLYQKEGFDRLCLAGPDEVRAALEKALHPYLRDRLAGHLNIGVAASIDEVSRAAHALTMAEQERAEAQLVEQLRAGVGSGHRAVAGLADVLQALAEHRIDRLLVSHGYAEPGWHCRACDSLAVVGRSCPSCKAEMEPVEDLVAEALDRAVAGSCRVDVCVANADLDVLGRIGALLRF